MGARASGRRPAVEVMVLVYVPPGERGAGYDGALWDNLRPSEAAELDDLCEGIMELGVRFEAMVYEVVVAAARTFAERHPDAPRNPKSLYAP